MKTERLYFIDEEWSTEEEEYGQLSSAEIVFVFGYVETLQKYNHVHLLKKHYPNADIVGVSTTGNILGNTLSEHRAVALALKLEKSKVVVKGITIRQAEAQEDAQKLIESLDKKGIKHILTFVQGLNVDASLILKGFQTVGGIPITGGVAGDSFAFNESCIFLNEECNASLAVVIAFYGENIHTGIGCASGWKEFGVYKKVTSSEGNIVYEIDNRPAREFYELYLGEYLYDLPNTALLFPLSVKYKDETDEIIRVLMSINDDGSILFAGDVPEGSLVRLMKTNVNNLIDGAMVAAANVKQYNDKESLTFVVSCSARLNVLRQLVDEEIEIVQRILGTQTQLLGFYSYGEIAPFRGGSKNSYLHNQTMTLTTLYED